MPFGTEQKGRGTESHKYQFVIQVDKMDSRPIHRDGHSLQQALSLPVGFSGEYSHLVREDAFIFNSTRFFCCFVLFWLVGCTERWQRTVVSCSIQGGHDGDDNLVFSVRFVNQKTRRFSLV